jgi:hypothetical protein
MLQAAIDQVLATPVVHGEIELKQPKVFYRFADSELESLSPLQKQIMRMGPSNTLRLQTFVRRLVKKETPQLCWGGTQSLTVPETS